MPWISCSTGRVTALETDSLWEPTAYLRNGRTVGIVAVHGAGATGLSPADSTLLGSHRLHRLLAARYPIVATDMGGANTWGNSAATAGIAAAKTYLQSTMGAKAGPVVLVAISMGNIAAHNYARANPGSVLGIVASIGASNLTQMYGNATYQAAIGTAWGVTFPTTLPNGADPLLNSYAMANYVNYYDTADTSVLPADARALATLVGGRSVAVSAAGHSETAVAAVPEQDLLNTVSAWVGP